MNTEICEDGWKIFYIVGVEDRIDGVWRTTYNVCFQCDGQSYDNKLFNDREDAIEECERLEGEWEIRTRNRAISLLKNLGIDEEICNEV